MSANILESLRQYTVEGKPILEEHGYVVFGELAWPRKAKTNFLISGNADLGNRKLYYSLESCLFLLQNKSMDHAEYLKKAQDVRIMPVKSVDRGDLLGYLTGKLTSSPQICNKANFGEAPQYYAQVKRLKEVPRKDDSNKKQKKKKIRNESPSKFGQTNPPQKNKCSCQEDKNRPDCSAGSEVKEQVKDFPDFDEDVFDGDEFSPTLGEYQTDTQRYFNARTLVIGPLLLADMSHEEFFSIVQDAQQFTVNYHKYKDTEEFRGTLELIFETVEETKEKYEALKALNMTSRMEIVHLLTEDGKSHDSEFIRRHGKPYRKQKGTRSDRIVVVVCLDPSVTEAQIHAQFPTALYTYIPYSYIDKTPKSYAYVEFLSVEEAKDVVGKPITIDGSEYKTRKLLHIVPLRPMVARIGVLSAAEEKLFTYYIRCCQHYIEADTEISIQYEHKLQELKFRLKNILASAQVKPVQTETQSHPATDRIASSSLSRTMKKSLKDEGSWLSRSMKRALKDEPNELSSAEIQNKSVLLEAETKSKSMQSDAETHSERHLEGVGSSRRWWKRKKTSHDALNKQGMEKTNCHGKPYGGRQVKSPPGNDDGRQQDISFDTIRSWTGEDTVVWDGPTDPNILQSGRGPPLMAGAMGYNMGPCQMGGGMIPGNPMANVQGGLPGSSRNQSVPARMIMNPVPDGGSVNSGEPGGGRNHPAEFYSNIGSNHDRNSGRNFGYNSARGKPW